METDQVASQGYEGKWAGQSVNAINKVDGIAAKYEYQHRERRTCRVGDGVNTEQPIKIVDVEVGRWN